MSIVLGIIALKKHYYNLLKSLPDNFMITMEKLCQSKSLDIDCSKAVDELLSCPSSEDANRKILDMLIDGIEKDRHFFALCVLMEALVDLNMKAAVYAVQDGKYT